MDFAFLGQLSAHGGYVRHGLNAPAGILQADFYAPKGYFARLCGAVYHHAGACVPVEPDFWTGAGALVFVVVSLHNLLGYGCGFGLGTLLRLSVPKTKALSIEIGMQNSGLASSLAATAFPSLAMATVPGAVFSVWHNISGSIAANFFARRDEKQENAHEVLSL